MLGEVRVPGFAALGMPVMIQSVKGGDVLAVQTCASVLILESVS